MRVVRDDGIWIGALAEGRRKVPPVAAARERNEGLGLCHDSDALFGAGYRDEMTCPRGAGRVVGGPDIDLPPFLPIGERHELLSVSCCCRADDRTNGSQSTART
jgi:hypothetical protein